MEYEKVKDSLSGTKWRHKCGKFATIARKEYYTTINGKRVIAFSNWLVCESCNHKEKMQ